MTRIIVTDSSSCLDGGGSLGEIQVLPFTLHIDDKSYQDGIDITPEQYIERVNNNPKCKLSSAPPPKHYLVKQYSEWLKQGVTEVIFVTISAKLSTLNDKIANVATLFNGKIKTHIFDTLSAGTGVGELAVMARNLMNQGLETEDILERLTIARYSMITYLTVEKLDYLISNQRLSAPSGFLGKLLNIKPLLTINSLGEIVPYTQIQGWHEVIEKMCIELQQITRGEPIKILTLYPDGEAGEEFRTLIRQYFPDPEIIHSLPSPVIMCHTGPAVFGVGAMIDSARYRY